MLCSNCSKLNLLYTNKKNCVKCHLKLSANLYVICDNCSAADKVCSVCFKKCSVPQPKTMGKCSTCGKK